MKQEVRHTGRTWRQHLKRRFLELVLRRCPQFFFRLRRIDHLRSSQDPEFLALQLQVLRDGRVLQRSAELYTLWRAALSVRKLEGDFAEVGVFRGGSSKLLCESKGAAALHLFDTFEGLPPVDAALDGGFQPGDFSATALGDVQQYLASYKNVFFYKGYFPGTAWGTRAETARFRFVHLDVDIYQSTLQSLEFFYPRMTRGGVLLSHDYENIGAAGVRQAFDEFFADKPEIVLSMAVTHCAVVKL